MSDASIEVLAAAPKLFATAERIAKYCERYRG
jgi:hypothetical protein